MQVDWSFAKAKPKAESAITITYDPIKSEITKIDGSMDVEGTFSFAQEPTENTECSVLFTP